MLFTILPSMQKNPALGGVFLILKDRLRKKRSGKRYARGLRALGTVFHIETYLLTFGEGLEAASLDGREVYEHVLAAVGGRNKSKTLGVVKPLYGTCSHCFITFNQ